MKALCYRLRAVSFNRFVSFLNFEDVTVIWRYLTAPLSGLLGAAGMDLRPENHVCLIEIGV